MTADREKLLDVLREIARVSGETLTDGRPVVPRMSLIHRLAAEVLDEPEADEDE